MALVPWYHPGELRRGSPMPTAPRSAGRSRWSNSSHLSVQVELAILSLGCRIGSHSW